MTTSIPIPAYPRLLVAAEFPPNGARGGGSGAVMRQMLKEWPSEKLFWWSCFPDRDCFFGQKVAALRVARIPGKMYPNRRWVALRSWMMDAIWVPWATRHLKRTLKELKPDVAWVHPHAWAIPPSARALPESGIGFHVSIHDYMDKGGAQRGRDLARQAEALYARAVTRDAISQQMVEDLQARYGVPGIVNRAGLEQEDFGYLTQPPSPPGKTVRIAYAGTIIATDAFALFMRMLGEIRPQLSRPVTFEFYGHHSYRSEDWFDPAWMSERGNLPAANLTKALKECDWAFSPMMLTDDPRFNRFSIPTKFAGYLQAGLPIIVMGHAESTVVKMASKYIVGLCVTGSDRQSLRAKLLAALSESNPKAAYRSEIQRCALAEFDVRRMRTELYDNFRKCASSTSLAH